MSKEQKSRFFRLYGGYIFGIILAAALICLAIVGKKTGGSSEIKLRYYQKYLTKEITDQSSDTESASDESSEPELTEQEIFEEYFDLKDLGLRYEAHINGFSGLSSSLYYDVTFKTALPDDIESQIENEIIKKCGKNVDDNRYGDVTVFSFPENRKVGIKLSLEKINTDKAIKGIFKALDEINGVESVTLDELLTLDSNVSSSGSIDYVKYFGIDKLGLSYSVNFKELDGENFTYNVIFSDKIDQSKLDTLSSEIVKALGDDTDSGFDGYYTIKKTADDTVEIYLDIGNADNVNAITGILYAINAVGGVNSVTIN